MDHLSKVSQVEAEQAADMESSSLKVLRKTQLGELKRHPKEIKKLEEEIKKSHTDTLKLQERSYKSMNKQISDSLSKQDQEALIRKRKEEQALKIAKLDEQLHLQLVDLQGAHLARLSAKHTEEIEKMKQDHETGRMRLLAYQKNRLMNHHQKNAQTQEELKKKLAHLTNTLEQFFATETEKLAHGDLSFKELALRQAHDLKDFRARGPSVSSVR